jgi:cation-transporting ATPase E
MEQMNLSPEQGLTQVEVAERFARGQVNLPVSSPTRSVRQIVLSNVFTYFNKALCHRLAIK